LENKRWHTDKVMHKLGLEVANEKLKDAFNTIARVMVELRREAYRSKTTSR